MNDLLVDQARLALDPTESGDLQHDVATQEIAPRGLSPVTVAELADERVTLLELEVGRLALQVGEQSVPAHGAPLSGEG